MRERERACSKFNSERSKSFLPTNEREDLMGESSDGDAAPMIIRIRRDAGQEGRGHFHSIFPSLKEAE